jgi:g-D-glutamyl-meso-diaminopimelate peptidase
MKKENYNYYTIKKGDQLYNIAKNNNATIQGIIAANTDLNPFLLEENKEIVIPYNNNIVNNNQPYDYSTYKKNIEDLMLIYPFIDVNIIGKSIDNRNIYSLSIGSGDRIILYNGAHHGNEWITSLLLMKWLENVCKVFTMKGNLRGYNIPQILQRSKIIIVPMVNPDGVDLVINGLDSINSNKKKVYKWNNNTDDFNKWKANLNGVDLNRNYNAGWYTHKKIEKELNVLGPGPSLYGGERPESEPEVSSMVKLSKLHNSRLSLSYHSQGRVIYWNYRGLEPIESYSIGLKFCEASTYKLDEPSLHQSHGGYKDWYISRFRKPGYTIEVGKGENPLSINQFDIIYENNEKLLLLATII